MLRYLYSGFYYIGLLVCHFKIKSFIILSKTTKVDYITNVLIYMHFSKYKDTGKFMLLICVDVCLFF